MRVVVGIEAHFYVVEGNAYSSYLTYESFWKRYLKVFDSVLIVARSTESNQIPDGYKLVTGPGVELVPLPRYHGPMQFLRKMPQISRTMHAAIKKDDACILRVAGNISTQLWKQLPSGHPFGLEVMSDPWVIFSPGSIKNIGRPFYRWHWTHNLKLQCQQASAASYVTEYTLQRRYPARKNAYTTHYSTIELDCDDVCKDTSSRLASILSIPERLVGKGPAVQLGFIGTFSQHHKLPHIHIEALAKCIAKGVNVTLDMIGDGVLLKDMQLLAKRLGVGNQVNFLGRLPGGKPILEAIDKFDIFLNAAAAEGLPRVVIEAMSRGCPCIASDVGGTAELLEGKFLVPPRDAQQLADTIMYVLKDTNGLNEAVQRNIQVARKYCRDMLEPRRTAFYEFVRKHTEKYLSE